MKPGDLLWYNSAGSRATAIVLDTFTFRGDRWGLLRDGDTIVRLAWTTDGIKPDKVSWWGDSYGRECNLGLLGDNSSHWEYSWYPARMFKMISES